MIGASLASPRSASAARRSTNPRNDVTPFRSARRAMSMRRVRLASACSPVGQIATPACARVAARKRVIVSAIGRRFRPRCRSRSTARAPATSASAGGRSPGTWRNGCSVLKRSRNARSAPSASAKNGPRSVANTARSSSGRSIAARALRSASTSSRAWNALPPIRTCGRWRASSARTYACVTSVRNERKRRKSKHTWRGAIGTRDPSGALTVQPLSRTSQSTKAAVASGSERSICQSTTLPKSPYGAGAGNATIAGCVATLGRTATSGTYDAWPTNPVMRGDNAAFTADWISGTARKLTVRYCSTAPASINRRFTSSYSATSARRNR